MLVKYRPRPRAPLDAHVDCLWYAARAALPHGRELSLPTGTVDIVIPLLQPGIVRFDRVDSLQAQHLHGGVVSGAHDRFTVRGMGGASEVIGVHFRPGGAAAFFGPVLVDMRNQTLLLDALWGAAASDLRNRLQTAPQVAQKFAILEQALVARLSDCHADAMVNWALRALAANPSAARIDTVQRASDCSPQQFIRRFEAVVGLTPKRHARVLRFNTMLPRIVRVGPRDWAEVAVAHGYYDQSHLIHEFKRLAGVTPGAYRPISADQPTHVPVIESHAAASRKNLQYAGPTRE